MYISIDYGRHNLSTTYHLDNDISRPTALYSVGARLFMYSCTSPISLHQHAEKTLRVKKGLRQAPKSLQVPKYDIFMSCSDTLSVFDDIFMSCSDTLSVFDDLFMSCSDTLSVFDDIFMSCPDTLSVFDDIFTSCPDTLSENKAMYSFFVLPLRQNCTTCGLAYPDKKASMRKSLEYIVSLIL